MNAVEERIPLGKSGILVSRMGLGAWAWGDRWIWGYGKEYGEDDARQAFQSSLEAGINFIDTAEVYGQGRSEALVGMFLREASASADPLVIATKFTPFPWRLGKSSLRRALRGSLARLGLERIDLYQVHMPLPPIPLETWADGMAEAVQAGLVRAVGVSNYNENQVRRTFLALSKRGVPLASNQIEYHLLDRRCENSGVMETCAELGVTVIAYSPLAQGVLTGKYTPANPPSGMRAQRYGRAYLEKIQPLLSNIRRICREHPGVTPSQVALNWTICKGTLPIPGAKNASQAAENAGALGWWLSPAEMAELDQVSQEVAG